MKSTINLVQSQILIDLIIDISNDLQFINHQITKEYNQNTENLVKSITGDFRIDSSTSNYFNLKTNISINNTILNNIDSVLIFWNYQHYVNYVYYKGIIKKV